MPATTYDKLKDEYKRLWDSMVVRDNWKRAVHTAAERILSHKNRYQLVEKKTGVPWYLIGALHNMETGSCDFTKHLHNGDPLSHRTRHVPRGRPLTGEPPYSWEESAIDALQFDGLDKAPSYPIERIAYLAEAFNGFGYRKRGVHSPYLFSGSTHYTSGKFVRDGVWSSGAVSQQVGVLPIIKRLSELDPTIKIYGENGDTGFSV